jgi:rubredoxin
MLGLAQQRYQEGNFGQASFIASSVSTPLVKLSSSPIASSKVTRELHQSVFSSRSVSEGGPSSVKLNTSGKWQSAFKKTAEQHKKEVNTSEWSELIADALKDPTLQNNKLAQSVLSSNPDIDLVLSAIMLDESVLVNLFQQLKRKVGKRLLDTPETQHIKLKRVSAFFEGLLQHIEQFAEISKEVRGLIYEIIFLDRDAGMSHSANVHRVNRLRRMKRDERVELFSYLTDIERAQWIEDLVKSASPETDPVSLMQKPLHDAMTGEVICNLADEMDDEHKLLLLRHVTAPAFTMPLQLSPDTRLEICKQLLSTGNTDGMQVVVKLLDTIPIEDRTSMSNLCRALAKKIKQSGGIYFANGCSEPLALMTAMAEYMPLMMDDRMALINNLVDGIDMGLVAAANVENHEPGVITTGAEVRARMERAFFDSTKSIRELLLHVFDFMNNAAEDTRRGVAMDMINAGELRAETRSEMAYELLGNLIVQHSTNPADNAKHGVVVLHDAPSVLCQGLHIEPKGCVTAQQREKILIYHMTGTSSIAGNAIQSDSRCCVVSGVVSALYEMGLGDECCTQRLIEMAHAMLRTVLENDPELLAQILAGFFTTGSGGAWPSTIDDSVRIDILKAILAALGEDALLALLTSMLKELGADALAKLLQSLLDSLPMDQRLKLLQSLLQRFDPEVLAKLFADVKAAQDGTDGIDGMDGEGMDGEGTDGTDGKNGKNGTDGSGYGSDGAYVCSGSLLVDGISQVCGHVYDAEKDGNGMTFDDLPDSFVCPSCGAPKSAFQFRGGRRDSVDKSLHLGPGSRAGVEASLSACEYILHFTSRCLHEHAVLRLADIRPLQRHQRKHLLKDQDSIGVQTPTARFVRYWMYHEINCLNTKGAMLSYTLGSNRDFIRFVVEVGLTVAQAKHSCVSAAAYKELVKLRAKMAQTQTTDAGKDEDEGLVLWFDKKHLEDAERVVEKCLGIPKAVLEFVRPIKEKDLEKEKRMTLLHTSTQKKGKGKKKKPKPSNTPVQVEAEVLVVEAPAEARVARVVHMNNGGTMILGTEDHFDPGSILRTQSLIRGFLVRQRMRLLQDWRLLYVSTYLFSFYHGLHPQYGGSAQAHKTPTLTELMLNMREMAGEKVNREEELPDEMNWDEMKLELRGLQCLHDKGAVVPWEDCHSLQMRLQQGLELVQIQVDHLRRSHHEHHLLARKGLAEQMACMMDKYNTLAAAYAAMQRGAGGDDGGGGGKRKGGDGGAGDTAARADEEQSRLKTPWTKILRRARRSKTPLKKMKIEEALKIVYDCYGKKLVADMVDDKNKKERTPLADFVYDYLVRRFGFQNIADQNLLAIVEAIKRAAKKLPTSRLVTGTKPSLEKTSTEQAEEVDHIGSITRTAEERLLMFGRLCGVISPETYTPRTSDIFLRALQVGTKDSDVAAFLRTRKVGSGESRLPAEQCVAAALNVFPLGMCLTKQDRTKDEGKQHLANAMKQASALTRLQSAFRGFATRRRVSVECPDTTAAAKAAIEMAKKDETKKAKSKKREVLPPTHNYCGMWRQQLRMTSSRYAFLGYSMITNETNVSLLR